MARPVVFSFQQLEKRVMREINRVSESHDKCFFISKTFTQNLCLHKNELFYFDNVEIMLFCSETVPI